SYAGGRQETIAARGQSGRIHLLDRPRADDGWGIEYEAAVLKGARMGSFVGAFWFLTCASARILARPNVVNHWVVARAASLYAGPGDITVRKYASLIRGGIRCVF